MSDFAELEAPKGMFSHNMTHNTIIKTNLSNHMVICISNKDVIITEDDTLRRGKLGFLEAAILVASF